MNNIMMNEMIKGIFICIIFIFIAWFIFSGGLTNLYYKIKVPQNESLEAESNTTYRTDDKLLTVFNMINDKDNIPGTDDSCEDYIPKNMTLKVTNRGYSLTFADISLLTNNKRLSGGCKYNTEVGEIASQFKCGGGYFMRNRISEEGIILEDYRVWYRMIFDDNNCSQMYIGGFGYIECEIIKVSCDWEYL